MSGKDQAGAILAETVIAVMVFAMLGTAVLAGVSTLRSSGARLERQAIAERVARSQMEYTFSTPYLPPPATYPPIETPPGYTVVATAEVYVPGDPRLERVVVRVDYEDRAVFTLETLRSQP
ncbi:hypothetical protein HRbin23_01186 [bacterium HR23]|nr:hypothetical protein HRbin23_01186 [bacterium HR23]